VTKYDGGTGLFVPVNQEPAMSKMSCGQETSSSFPVNGYPRLGVPSVIRPLTGVLAESSFFEIMSLDMRPPML
jgi:hypothetical protein